MKSDFPHITCECCVVEMSTMRSPFEINLPVVVVAVVVAAAAVAVISYPYILEYFKERNACERYSKHQLRLILMSGDSIELGLRKTSVAAKYNKRHVIP